MLNFVVDGQHLYLYDDPKVVVDGSANFVFMRFVFSREWDGYTKSVRLKKGDEVYTIYIGVNGGTYLPADITAGVWAVSVLGELNSSRASSSVITLRVEQSL